MNKVWKQLKAWLAHAGASTGPVVRAATSNTSEVLKDAGVRTGGILKDAAEIAVRSTSEAARVASDFYDHQFGEDSSRILAECPIATNILQHREMFETDPKVFSQLYNVRIRPLVTAAALAASGTGAVAYETALSRITRHIFDGNQLVGNALGDRVASLVGVEKTAAVNRFMDKVPGSDVMGGGWLHRIQHGHDAEALVRIGEEYGSEGVIQGLYHIFGRDFFTPAGIPILPSGSEQVQAFLVKQFNMSASAAADLISLNSAEVAAVVAVIIAARLGWKCLEEYEERAELQKLIMRASTASEIGDFMTAAALYQHALAMRPQEGTVSFALGMVRYRAGNHLDAFLRFRDAASWLASSEPTVEVGGAALSLRGVAAGMALASVDAPARADRHGSDWMMQVQQIAMAGITAYRTIARDLEETRVTPARHLSAALNYYLAGRLVGAAMYLPEREEHLKYLCRKLHESLVPLEKKGEHLDKLRFIKQFSAAEFLPSHLV